MPPAGVAERADRPLPGYRHGSWSSPAPWGLALPALGAAALLALAAGRSALGVALGRAVALALLAASAVAPPVARHLAERLGRRDPAAVLPAALGLLCAAVVMGGAAGAGLAIVDGLDLRTGAAAVSLVAALTGFFAALFVLGAARDSLAAGRTIAIAAAISAAAAAAFGRSAGPAGVLAGAAAGPLAGLGLAASRLLRQAPSARPLDPWLLREVARHADAGAAAVAVNASLLVSLPPPGPARAAAALGLIAALPGLALVFFRFEPLLHGAFRDLLVAISAGAPAAALPPCLAAMRTALRKGLAGLALAGGAIAFAGALLAPGVLAAAGVAPAADVTAAFRAGCLAGAVHAELILVLAALDLAGRRGMVLFAAALLAAGTAIAGYPAAAALATAVGAGDALRALRTLDRDVLAALPLAPATPAP
jgi:hypothetical protein